MLRFALLNLLFLVLTAPWFFISNEATPRDGLPFWVFYVLGVAFLYAVFVSINLGRIWNSEEDDDAS